MPRVITTKKAKRKKAHRAGTISRAEKKIVAAFVADQPAEVTPGQTQALSRLLRRSLDETKSLIAEARETFVSSASDYVNIHKQATQEALANGTPKGLEQALRGSQWALENIGEGGVRVVDRAAEGQGGTKVYIGLKIGGIDEKAAV